MTRGRGWLVGLAAALLLAAGCTAVVAMARTNAPGGAARPTPKPDAVAKGDASLVFSGDRRANRVAITFDLCETPGQPAGFDRGLVDALRAEEAPATFMMGGHWARTHPQEALLLGSTPYFEIGNHTSSHPHATRIPTAEFRADVELGQRQIEEYAGVTPSVFRFPYGEHDATTLDAVRAEGLVAVQWSVEPSDPERSVSADDILRVVQERTRNGSIIILHANGRGWHTAEAMPRVVRWLRAQGYELVTVSDLLAPLAE